MKYRRTRPRFKTGDVCKHSLLEANVVISKEPSWNGIMWMYNFEGMDMRSGEMYLSRADERAPDSKIMLDLVKASGWIKVDENFILIKDGISVTASLSEKEALEVQAIREKLMQQCGKELKTC